METNEITKPKTSSLIGAFLILIATICRIILMYGNASNGIEIYQSRASAMIENSLVIASLVLLLFYFFNGGTKQDHKLYKGSLLAFALSRLIYIALDTGLSGITNASQAIMMAGALILMLATDLGKTKSLAVAIISMLAVIVHLVMLIIGDYSLVSIVFIFISEFAVAFVMISAILTKYSDKAERGR